MISPEQYEEWLELSAYELPGFAEDAIETLIAENKTLIALHRELAQENEALRRAADAGPQRDRIKEIWLDTPQGDRLLYPEVVQRENEI